MALLKGFEVEVFTGTRDGEVVGLSDRIRQHLDWVVLEPDSRNLEYITPPLAAYRDLLRPLLEPRMHVRRVLEEMGGYTVVPGSTMPLRGATGKFVRSDPGNAYHDRIQQAYGTRVVTASVHINFGLPYIEDVIRATRLLRLDAPVVLALTASSPFLEGEPSGYHSTRWEMFPRTPRHVPLFVDHRDYVDWMQQQLKSEAMWNVRHLWAAARPNGPDRPYGVDRAELRIPDLVMDPRVLLGITLALENRITRLLEGRLPDPLSQGTPAELLAMEEQNQRNAAQYSLDALIADWRSGETVTARALAKAWVDEVRVSSLNLTAFEEWTLRGVDEMLDGGNEAMRWLRRVEQGRSVPEVVAEAIQDAEDRDRRLALEFLEDR